jgi:hypothetical protein
MNDILFSAPSYFVEMPINTTWNVLNLEPISDYYVLKIALPERISIS